MIVMIDADWKGSPGVEGIRKRMSEHLASAGWITEHGLAVVLDPEIDVWLWTRTDHTAEALGWKSWRELEPCLVKERMWTKTQRKPQRAKEAADWAMRQRGKPRSAAAYRAVAQKVGLDRCEDPAFLVLRDTIRAWFPTTCRG